MEIKDSPLHQIPVIGKQNRVISIHNVKLFSRQYKGGKTTKQNQLRVFKTEDSVHKI